MAVKAAAEVTITDNTDIDSLVTWYYLTTSATKPAAPTTTKTSVAPPSPWTQAEPTFTAGTVTNYLYTCVQTRWKDGSCAWGAVQLSSAYEQAKQAWNKANAAQGAADAMSETVGTLEAPYTEVEWVESNGKQFVYLDWKPPIATWGFEADFIIRNAFNTTQAAWNADTNKNNAGMLFGTRNATGVNDAELGSYGSTGWLRTGNSTNHMASGYMKTDRTSRQTLKYVNTTLTKADGSTVTIARTSETANKPYANMVVFAMYEGLRRSESGNLIWPSTCRVYSLKFYDGATLEVDLVGAVRKKDGVTGLYDKVAGKFYPAPGMTYGTELGDLGDVETVSGYLAKNSVQAIVDNPTNTRMLRASTPELSKLEDGQQLRLTYMYAISASVQTTELAGWNDTSNNSNVYLKLSLSDDSETEWIPCYYNGYTRLTTHYFAGQPLLLTYRENVFVGASATGAGYTVMRGFFCDPNYDTNTYGVGYQIYFSGKASADRGIWQTQLFMEDADGTYQGICTASDGTITTANRPYSSNATTFMNNTKAMKANSAALKVGGQIYFLNGGSQNAGATLNGWGQIYSHNTNVIDSRYSFNPYGTGTTLSLVANKPLYLVGTVGDDGLFYLDSTWHTQTPNNTSKVYVLVGNCYDNYRFMLVEQNTWLKWDGEKLVDYEKWLADEAAKVAGNYIVNAGTTGDAWVHSEGHGPDANGDATADTYGWRIGSVFELVRAGLSYIKMWVDGTVAKVRVGLESAGHAVFSSGGMEVFTDASTNMASFGSDGARIGKAYVSGASDNESHMELDYHSLQMVDKEGNTYYHVSDLRGHDGTFTYQITESYEANTVPTLDLPFSVASDGFTVWDSTAGADDTANWSRQQNSSYQIYRVSQIAAKKKYKFTLVTDDSMALAFTFGSRDGDHDVGGTSVTFGKEVAASGSGGFAHGRYSYATGDYSFASGSDCEAQGRSSHAEGDMALALGDFSHAEGTETTAEEPAAHAEGAGSNATGYASHAENESNARGDWSHAEGGTGKLNATYQFVGHNPPAANGHWSHAEGVSTTTAAAAYASHAEGACTTASEKCAHAEGYETSAGLYAHAEGYLTEATGAASHAEGLLSEASGESSHAQNLGTKASSTNQTALGKYNVEDAADAYAVIIGNGTADDARSNALGVDWNGNVVAAGDVTANGKVLTRTRVKGNAESSYRTGDVNLTPANIGAAAASHGNHVPATQTADNATYLRNDNTWHKITPANIGAAAASHGNHVPATQTADNKKFLRNDNTWQTVTPANIGAAPTSHNHAAGDINSGTLPLARGGTGASLSAAPSIIVNLASTSGASPFAASPRPGVTGVLPQAHGGTGLGTAFANITSYDLGSTPIKTSTWTECRYPASGTSAPARVKPGAGVYIVFLSFAFASNATGSRLITAGTTSNVTGYSDSNYLAARLQASSSGTTKSTTATVTEFGADDTLYVRAWQDSGASINCAVHVRLVRIA